MVNATNLKNGSFFLNDGHPYKVLDYSHIKMARGGATVKIKAKDMISGAIKDISLSNNDRVEEADIENRNMQYLYHGAEGHVFMDVEDYSQVEVADSNIEDEEKYLAEGKNYQIVMYDGKPISMILPASIYYKVTKAYPAVKGNTSNSASKKVTLENGLEVDAPQFIKEGDTIKINTTSGQYVSRGN